MKPMLAHTARPDLSDVRFPCILQPKYDGIRAVLPPTGPLVSRNLKPIRNQALQDMLINLPRPDFSVDGELLPRHRPTENAFNRTQSLVKADGPLAELSYCIFDMMTESDYINRHRELVKFATRHWQPHLASGLIMIVPGYAAMDRDTVDKYETAAVANGWEGVMIRQGAAGYEQGKRSRSLLKVKRFEDAEATVLDYECMYTNENEKTTDALGHAKRSSHAANKKPLALLGALRCRREGDGVEFSVGTGWTLEERALMWATKTTLLGRTLTYKHQPSGAAEAPRFPTFLRWRDPE